MKTTELALSTCDLSVQIAAAEGHIPKRTLNGLEFKTKVRPQLKARCYTIEKECDNRFTAVEFAQCFISCITCRFNRRTCAGVHKDDRTACRQFSSKVDRAIDIYTRRDTQTIANSLNSENIVQEERQWMQFIKHLSAILRVQTKCL